VNSSQGGGSKDTWVLAGRATKEDERELGGAEIVSEPPSSPTAEQGPELNSQQIQQQQQQLTHSPKDGAR
jgi:hypothetical protein